MASADLSHLETAKQANAIVKKKLTIGPGNRWFSGMGAALCVKLQRRESTREIERRATDIKRKAAAAGKGQAAEWAKWEQVIGIWAKNAEAHHCGNCAEHAAIAFTYLKNAGTRPIEYMGYLSGYFEDHAFVVIGRKPDSDINKPVAWGSDVAICDPYYGKAYPAARIESEMGSKAKRAPKLICRLG
jgi:hypothetical protein